MKRILSLLFVFALILSLAACGAADQVPSTPSDTQGQTNPVQSAQTDAGAPGTDGQTDGDFAQSGTDAGTRVLVAYFSCTGNTKAVAEKIAALTGGDLYEIVPAEPYSAADLNYNNSNCRANREMNDFAARPAIGSKEIDISAYDTVILGYPIWWGTMPRIINTFLDTYGLSGKTVLPFCTSGGSGVSKSLSDIRAAAPGATVKDGLRVSGAEDKNTESWLRESGVEIAGQGTP